MDINKIRFKNVQYALEKDVVLHFSPNRNQRREGMLDRDYTIIGTLGQGGFGMTYLATTNIGHIQQVFVAIKEFFYKGKCSRNVGNPNMIFPEAAEAKKEVEACLDAFKKEAGILHQICEQTPNIVKVNEVFSANNTAYYVMEYLEDGNLREVVKNGALRENIALSYILPVAKAVSMLHTMKKPLLHCDIKHDNIMLRKNLNGEIVPVLIDFGEVLHFDEKGDLTTTHNIIGCSRGFAPLEQYAGVTKFTPTIDVYALAATLYYLLTGDEPPFAGKDNIEDLINKRLPASISDFVRNAIIHGMKKDKINRTATVADFIKELGGKIPPPLVADELQPECILENKNKKYFIKSIEERKAFYIHYKIWSIDGNVANPSSTMTERISYDMYEFFDKNNHDRISDKSVIAKGDIKAAQQQFLNLCKKITKNQIGNEFKEVTFESKWVTFKANNTQYIVDYHYRKLLPWKKIFIYAGIIVGCLLLIYTGKSIYNSIIEANVKEREQMSLRLTNAIATSNAESLRIFAENDSVRAFAPYANLLFSQGKLDSAKHYAEKALPDLLASSLIAEIDSIMDIEKKINDFALSIEDGQESTVKPTRVSDDELYKQAMANSDWDLLKKLADSGYSKAYIPLAEHYLGDRSKHHLSNEYAQKAKKRGISKADSIIEKLRLYDFY